MSNEATNTAITNTDTRRRADVVPQPTMPSQNGGPARSPVCEIEHYVSATSATRGGRSRRSAQLVAGIVIAALVCVAGIASPQPASAWPIQQPHIHCQGAWVTVGHGLNGGRDPGPNDYFRIRLYEWNADRWVYRAGQQGHVHTLDTLTGKPWEYTWTMTSGRWYGAQVEQWVMRNGRWTLVFNGWANESRLTGGSLLTGRTNCLAVW